MRESSFQIRPWSDLKVPVSLTDWLTCSAFMARSARDIIRSSLEKLGLR